MNVIRRLAQISQLILGLAFGNLWNRRNLQISNLVAAIACLCFLTSPASAQNAVYPRIEASFNITGISTDPVVLFDYTQTDVEVSLLQPDSTTITLPAFYDGGTTWRVRHTPTQAGTYAVSGITLNGSAISVGNLTP